MTSRRDALLGLTLLPPGVPVRDAEGREAAGPADLRAGMTVAVSGLWRGDAVVAGAVRVLRGEGPARQAVLRGQLRRAPAGPGGNDGGGHAPARPGAAGRHRH